VRALIAYPLAILAGMLPKCHWEDIDLPVRNLALASALVTFWAGTAVGITGFFTYMAYVLAGREWTAPPLMLVVFISYVFVTPRGLFSLYLTATGLLRAVAWYTGEPFGDPILTGVDWLWRRLRSDGDARSARNARLALEKIDEPDRLYEGNWASLPNVTYVVVAARRKPGWTMGTWVITNDGWFKLGEPFDRPTPNGLRTVYPLTLNTNSLEVLRKGVSYELPRLRQTPVNPAKAGHHSNTEDRAKAAHHPHES
jgi:hypothetical protein